MSSADITGVAAGAGVERGGGGLRGFAHILRYFLPYLLPIWDKVLLRFLLSNASTFLGVSTAVAAGWVVDRGLLAYDMREFLLWLGFGFSLAMANFVAGAIGAVIGTYIAIDLEVRFRLDMLTHLYRQSIRFFQSRPIGEHMYRTNDDTSVGVQFLGLFFLQLCEKLQMFLLSLGLAFAVNPTTAWLVLTYVCLYVPVCHFTASYVRGIHLTARHKIQEAFARLQENLLGYPVDKAFGTERRSLRSYYAVLAVSTRLLIKYLVAMTFFNHMANATGLLRGLFLLLTSTLFLGYHVIVGDMTPGDYVFTGALILQMLVPVEEMVFALGNMRIWTVPAERMLQTFEVQPEITDAPHAQPLANPRAPIVFENVSFRYTPEGPDVVRNLSFRVEPGTKVAFVGPSGAGKTSVFNLLMRFYEPTEGRISIGNQDLRQMVLSSYHAKVGLVLQEAHLFSASLRDNILLGNPGASEEDLQRVLESTGMTELVRALPAGLDSVISESGNLSSGDRQRIAIARALLRDPVFLFLDEPTSLLDPETARAIVDHLNRAARGRTCLLIAHSLRMVVDADRIVVMDRGEAVESGTHEQLLASRGLYRRMWEAELQEAEAQGTKRPSESDP